MKPWKYYKDIFSIDYSTLKDENKTVLLFDLDNTIINNRVKDVTDKEIALFRDLEKKGFRVFIVSNSFPWRVKKICNRLSIMGFGFACKPLTFNVSRIVKKYKMNKDNTVIIGDQIYTDVLCATKLGIKSILVDPIDIYESFITMFNRGRENDIINRGDYYE